MSRRKSFLVGALILSVISFAGGISTLAQEPEEFPQGPEGGAQLAAKMRSLQPEENGKWHGTLKISHRPQKTAPIPVLCETTSSGTSWSVMYLASATDTIGAEKLTVIHSGNAPNRYIYARAATPGGPLGEPKELTGAQADIPLATTDFWLADLGFEFYHWPQQRLLKGELRNVAGASRSCYVLESVNPHPGQGGYARVVSWIEKEHCAPLAVKAYTADNPNKVFKEFVVSSFKKKQVKELEIDNNKTGSTTRLEFDLESQ